MSRKRKRRHKNLVAPNSGDRQQKGSVSEKGQIAIAKRIVAWLWAGVGVVSTLVGLYAYLPKLTISSPSPVQSGDPFGSAFLIRNESLFAVRKVNLRYFLNNIEGFHDYPGAQISNQRTRISGVWISAPEDKPPISVLERGESSFLVFPQRLLQKFTYGDVKIVADYSCGFLPLSKHEEYRFISRQENGAIVWHPVGAAEPVQFSEPASAFFHLQPHPLSAGKVNLQRVDP